MTRRAILLLGLLAIAADVSRANAGAARAAQDA